MENQTCEGDFCFCEKIDLAVVWSFVPIFHTLILGGLTVSFVIYLLATLPKSLRCLSRFNHRPLYVYYAFVWCVIIYNLFRCAIFMIQDKHYFGIFYVIFNFFYCYIEISVLIFLVRFEVGNTTLAFRQTSILAAIICLIILAVQCTLEFAMKPNIHLDTYSEDSALYWISQSAILGLCYFLLLVMHFTRLKQSLPLLPQFYHYVVFLFIVECLRVIESFFVFLKQVPVASCFALIWHFMYFGFFAPILYWVFLYRTFSEVSLPDYYSQMYLKDFFTEEDENQPINHQKNNSLDE